MGADAMGPELPPGQDGDSKEAASSSDSSLFWSENPEDYENHPDFIAMQAAMDEFTPFEEAEAWKKQGNDKVRLARKAAYAHMKRRYQREAVVLYSRAIGKAKEDPETPAAFLSTCYNNRAQMNLTLTNYRSALEDAEEAIRLDGTSKKAYFRGVKAALELKDAEKAADLGRRGIPHSGGDREYAELMREVDRVAVEVGEERREESRRADESLSTAVQFAVLLRQRGVKVGLPSFPDIQNKPYLDEQSVMHWPVIMLYPESGQVELIEDFAENSAFDAMLDMMFRDDGSDLPWDERGEYTRRGVTLYYSAGAGEPMPQKKLLEWLDGHNVGEMERTWRKDDFRKIDPKRTLAEVLTREDCVLPGLPTVYVVAENDFHREKFFNGDF
ncbi:tetratricopeptide repeat protein [Chloropicon roscoffensis]|uniref:Tetratricopeptide repeat protein n=2 Tax=Chloropicon roscoffensis TaxID=1461544 RepID=A0AAX4P068_9CHLO